MSFFQLSAVLFALCMIYVVRVHAQRAKLASWEANGWYILWLLFITLAIFPHWLQGISDTFYFDRVFDLLVVGAFMVLSVIMILTYFRYREVQHKLEKLVTSTAVTALEAKLNKPNLGRVRSRQSKPASKGGASRRRLSKPRARQAE